MYQYRLCSMIINGGRECDIEGALFLDKLWPVYWISCQESQPEVRLVCGFGSWDQTGMDHI